MEIDVLGVKLELDVDLTDAAGAEQWEATVNELLQSLKEVESGKGFKQSEVIRGEIDATKQWLDSTFGAGAGAKVFEGRDNLKTVYIVQNLMRTLHVVYIPIILNDAWLDALKQYSPERAKRKK